MASAPRAQGSTVVALSTEAPHRRLTWGDGLRSAHRRRITLVDLRPFVTPCVGVPGKLWVSSFRSQPLQPCTLAPLPLASKVDRGGTLT